MFLLEKWVASAAIYICLIACPLAFTLHLLFSSKEPLVSSLVVMTALIFAGCYSHLCYCNLEICWNQKYWLGLDSRHLGVQYIDLLFAGSYQIRCPIRSKWKSLE